MGEAMVFLGKPPIIKIGLFGFRRDNGARFILRGFLLPAKRPGAGFAGSGFAPAASERPLGAFRPVSFENDSHSFLLPCIPVEEGRCQSNQGKYNLRALVVLRKKEVSEDNIRHPHIYMNSR